MNLSNKEFPIASAIIGVPPHHHQAKVLKYPLNENFLSLQIVTLKSQLIFSFWRHYQILKLMGMVLSTISIF
ncbi:hypothetical protein CN634_28015 [Bacillus pseudomycoides]|nr:hypothetical protein CN634_28015 [Bacillus pseudomycoides]